MSNLQRSYLQSFQGARRSQVSPGQRGGTFSSNLKSHILPFFNKYTLTGVNWTDGTYVYKKLLKLGRVLADWYGNRPLTEEDAAFLRKVVNRILATLVIGGASVGILMVSYQFLTTLIQSFVEKTKSVATNTKVKLEKLMEQAKTKAQDAEKAIKDFVDKHYTLLFAGLGSVATYAVLYFLGYRLKDMDDLMNNKIYPNAQAGLLWAVEALRSGANTTRSLISSPAPPTAAELAFIRYQTLLELLKKDNFRIPQIIGLVSAVLMTLLKLNNLPSPSTTRSSARSSKKQT